METVIVDDQATLRQLASWMRARGKERRETIWFRDADAAENLRCRPFHRAQRLVPTELRLRRLWLRHLRRVPKRHKGPESRIR
jgi:hypothetical protein